MTSSKQVKQKVLCNICDKTIRENAKAVCCDICDNWVHIKCNSISPNRYDELCDEENDESFYCIKCFKEALPFGFANDNNFHQAVTLGLNSENFDDLNFTISKTEKKIMKFLKKTISENSDPNIKNSLCKYYTIDDFC